ncbi:hypothetical protein AAFN86_11655 [Roseomonas sp. CAU 1739]|uniref:hypothetical protein n=1 Tax=Roseomonas sp. CAU 1739 TaxID=3140364 RepID=UPI00325B8118
MIAPAAIAARIVHRLPREDIETLIEDLISHLDASDGDDDLDPAADDDCCAAGDDDLGIAIYGVQFDRLPGDPDDAEPEPEALP